LSKTISASEFRPGGATPDQFRYERKFAITGASLAEVEHQVRHHPAIFRREYPARIINNIYFDSSDLRNYRQNVDGHRQRAKLRVRWYGPLFGAVPRAVLEHKCKHGLLGTKHSAPLAPLAFGPPTTAAAVRQWLAASDLPEALRHEVQQVEPTLVNQYHRQYFRAADRQVRLTIDSALTFFPFRRHTNSFLAPVAVPNLVVLELKYSEAAGDCAAAIASQLPFRLTRMSKYVFGLDAIGGG